VIAATVAGMPDRLGGIRMAISVAELARAGITPDWMPGVVPRCVPVVTRQNQQGERAVTIVVGTERVKTRGKWRTVKVLACPVTWRPYPEQSRLRDRVTLAAHLRLEAMLAQDLLIVVRTVLTAAVAVEDTTPRR